MHRRLNDITQRIPSNFYFREWRSNGIEYVRIYFLLSDFIYYCDTPISDQNCPKGVSDFDCTIPSSSIDSDRVRPSSSASNSNRSSKHEVSNTQPLQPNQLMTTGSEQIEYFEYDVKNSRFVFSNGNNLYHFDDFPEKMVAPHVPIKVQTKIPQPKTDFRICPSNADLIAFLCKDDLWCVNLKTNQEIQITNVGLSHSSNVNGHQARSSTSETSLGESDSSCSRGQKIDSSPILVGRPSHVMREEFRRNQGYWWRPESEYHVVNESGDFSEYQILYEETDQSHVDIVNIPAWDGNVERQRFPKAGKLNAISKLCLAKFKYSSRAHEMYDLVRTDIVSSLHDIYPEYEYLVRAGWLGQDAIWCQLLNRRQTHLVIVAISLSNSFNSQIIYDEKNEDYWVGVHDIIHFLNVTKIDFQPLVEGSEISFIWSSEESNFRHLYMIKIQLGLGMGYDAKLVAKIQLTEGPWEVNEKDFWIDEDRKLIYFCGLRDTPLEKQLYALSYADCFREKSNQPRFKIHRLTELNYFQSPVAFNANCSLYVNIQSSISVPPFGFVNRIVPASKSKRGPRRLPDSKRLALLLVNSFNYPSYEASEMGHLRALGSRPSIMYDCQADLLPGLTKPELFCCQLANGDLIYGSIFKPEFMESGVRYPTVLEVYGGPEIQLVSNNFMTLRHPTRHLLSAEGYVVVLIDCRGTGRRGLSFEAYTHRKMGQVELIDQIEVLKWLSKNTGYIDLSRVCIKGWSYGGYLALMALAQYPKFFKMAIAGAPVVDWQMYDTAYTERFMGLPDENQEGYFKGNVLNYVHHFPDQ